MNEKTKCAAWTKIGCCMMAMMFSLVLFSCAEEDEWTDPYSEDDSGSGTTTDAAETTASEVLNFSVSFDSSDKSNYSTSGETAPSNESDTHYEDYLENFTTTATMTITYDGSSATADKDIDGVEVSIDGADVTVSSTTAGVTYVLTGSSTDGSFRMAKSSDNKKFGLTLNGLTLTKKGAPAINIQPSKRCYLKLSGSNTLADSGDYDSSDEDRKACLFTEGKLLIGGSGTLKVSSATKHAIASDAYVWLHDGADLTLVSDSKDGIHANDSVVVTGGAVSISAYGDGIDSEGAYVQTGGFVSVTVSSANSDRSHGVKAATDVEISGGALQASVSDKGAKALKTDGDITISGGKLTLMTTGAAVIDSGDSDYTSSSGMKADGNISISGGTVQAQSTGTGGKGLNSDGTISISGGTVQVATTGKRVGSGNTTSSPKGIKCDGILTISGGNVAVKLSGTGDGTEGIESKSEIYIKGGCTASYCYDDAINSASNFYIQGGYIYAHSLNNDAIDANKNLYIQGGNTVAIGAGGAENALDAAEGYSIYVSGGNVFGVGGSVSQTASSSSQASIAFSASLSGKTIGLFDNSGNGLFAVTVPTTSCTACYMTADGMKASTSYTLKSDVSISGGTTWCGINVDGTISGGSSLGSVTAAASVGTSMGGGGGMPSRGGMGW